MARRKTKDEAGRVVVSVTTTEKFSITISEDELIELVRKSLPTSVLAYNPKITMYGSEYGACYVDVAYEKTTNKEIPLI